jgi:hypothetical protein
MHCTLEWTCTDYICSGSEKELKEAINYIQFSAKSAVCITNEPPCFCNFILHFEPDLLEVLPIEHCLYVLLCGVLFL